MWVVTFEGKEDKFIVGYYETERAAYMEGAATELGYMNAEYWIYRKYEEPSDYYKLIARLHTVDWSNEAEREAWKKAHIKAREAYIRKKLDGPRFKVFASFNKHGIPLKTEKEVLDAWEFEPYE